MGRYKGVRRSQYGGRRVSLARYLFPVKGIPQSTRDVLKSQKAKLKRLGRCPVCHEKSLYVFRLPDATVMVCANPRCEAFGWMSTLPDVKTSDIEKAE